MTLLHPPEEKRSLRRFSLGIGSTYALKDGVIQVEDSEHVDRFKELGFTEIKAEGDESTDFDIDGADYDELKEFAKDAELDVDLRLGEDKLRASIKEQLG